MNKNRRRDILDKIINDPRSYNALRKEINSFKWDSDVALVTLDIHKLKNIIFMYIRDEISKDEVENWANFIECRDDIDFSQSSSNIIADIIYELANPTLTEELTKERAKQLISAID